MDPPSSRAPRHHQRLHVWLAPLIFLLVAVPISYRFALMQHHAESERSRDAVRADLEPIRGQLGRELFGAIHLTEGFASLVAVDGGISPERFEAIASELLRRSRIIRNIAIAPDNVVSLVFPLAGNESVLGFSYAQNADQWPSVKRMMEERRRVVAGPVKLVQGGIGVIGRTPIFLRQATDEHKAQRYWGLASTVIDFDALLHQTSLFEVTDRLDVAIRGLDGLGGPGQHFWGSHAVFDRSPITMDVVLPSGTWQLAGLPRGGWPSFRPLDSRYFHLGNLIALTLAILLFRLLQVGEKREFEVRQRRHAESVLRRANRALRLFSLVKGTVVRAKDEVWLLAEVCRIAVESAGYPMAWIGRAESDERKTVRPITFAGPGKGFLDKIFVSWGDNEFGHGTAGSAIRNRAPAVARDIGSHPGFAEWRGALSTRNFASAIAVPLLVRGEVFGVLLIYASEPDAFDDTEVGLLEDLGDTLSYGMASLAAHRDRAAAMTALERAHDELEERVRERTRELQIAKDAAESADRIKSAFLATMSHELRTPLNSIIGFTGILVQGLAGEVNAEQRKQLGMVQTSAQHLLSLINDVLDLSKIEAGQLSLASERFDLAEVVGHALGALQPLADRKAVRLSARLGTAVGSILGDRRRVEQVLLNLLSNAVKFTEGGEVTVEVTRKSDHVQVAVRDTGIGIPSKHRRSLFEPFFQIDSGLTRRHEGTGLGLSICRRLVELMGGTIQVSSTPGEGSVFTFTLATEPAGS